MCFAIIVLMKTSRVVLLLIPLAAGGCSMAPAPLEVPTPGVVVCYWSCTPPPQLPFDAPPEVLNLEAVSATAGAEISERLGNTAVGINETAIVAVLIGTDGVAKEVRLVEATTYRQTNELAVDVATALQFFPAMLRGRPTEVWMPVTIPIRREASRPVRVRLNDD